MSDAIFPTLPGLSFDMQCNSQFTTVVHTPVAGREVRAAFSAYPLWLFSLNFDFLDDTPEGEADLATLHGFILQRRGRFDSFLYEHRTANAVTDQWLGLGNGVKTDWPLKRAWGGFVEPVENPKSQAVITRDGEMVGAADYSISPTGLVSFAAPPAEGAILRWSGGYYFRCRFESDETDFTEFLDRLYRHDALRFVGSPVNKV